MATFLFLVSVSATILLLIAIAAEEVVRVTRRFFAGGRAEHDSASSVSAVVSTPVSMSPRAAVASRPTVATQNDWVPDRAA